MLTKNKDVREMVLFFLFISVFLIGTVGLVFADGTPVPADSPPGATAAAGSTPAVAGAPAAPSMGSMLLPFGLMFLVMYLFMIRPQKKRMAEQQKLLSELKHGDEVVTQSGILGTIRGITDKVVTLEVADNVRVKIMKSQVGQVVKGQIKDLA